MEQWQDSAIILSVRAHGESGAIVSLLTENHGRYAGYIRGRSGTKMRGTLEVGNKVDAQWQSRTSDQLGWLKLELSCAYAARNMGDALRLSALQSACALCDAALPEREGHSGLMHGLEAMFDNLDSDIWLAAYVMWEIALLKELGFSLDLTACAGGGDDDLIYVSPKTGRAVSRAAGEVYKEKLLTLPRFLSPQRDGSPTDEELLDGLKMTGYFLDHWVFAHHSGGTPEARNMLWLRFNNSFVTT